MKNTPGIPRFIYQSRGLWLSDSQKAPFGRRQSNHGDRRHETVFGKNQGIFFIVESERCKRNRE
eukprot:316211-Amorphochlora_amoeboformis.AAC.1